MLGQRRRRRAKEPVSGQRTVLPRAGPASQQLTLCVGYNAFIGQIIIQLQHHKGYVYAVRAAQVLTLYVQF